MEQFLNHPSPIARSPIFPQTTKKKYTKPASERNSQAQAKKCSTFHRVFIGLSESTNQHKNNYYQNCKSFYIFLNKSIKITVKSV